MHNCKAAATTSCWFKRVSVPLVQNAMELTGETEYGRQTVYTVSTELQTFQQLCCSNHITLCRSSRNTFPIHRADGTEWCKNLINVLIFQVNAFLMMIIFAVPFKLFFSLLHFLFYPNTYRWDTIEFSVFPSYCRPLQHPH